MQQFTFSIRRAGSADAQDAFGLIEEYCGEINVVVRDHRKELEHYLADEQGGIWLARCTSRVHTAPAQREIAAGCILLRPLSRLPGAGEIKRLYVCSAYRGRGIAKALLLALEQYACEHGMYWLYLDTKDDLHAAITFYRQSGYQPCERYNDNPQATIFMRKQLVWFDR